MLAGMLGLALALVGLDPMTAYPRYTFGMSEFLDGISFVPVMIGLFGLAEVLVQISERHSIREIPAAALGRILPRAAEWKKMLPAMFGGATLGTLVGAIPAAGGDIGSVIAWEQTRRLSSEKDKQEFGKGSLRGLAASCAACNGAIGGAMTTMLTLRCPFATASRGRSDRTATPGGGAWAQSHGRPVRRTILVAIVWKRVPRRGRPYNTVFAGRFSAGC